MAGAIEFLGPLSHDKVVHEFHQPICFVCPSLWEDPFPLVNLEAMGAGTPVVAFARGGIPEAVGDAGVCSSRRRCGHFGCGITALLETHRDAISYLI